MIQRDILDKLSLDILDDKFHDGDKIVARLGKNETIEFEKAPLAKNK